ncbi:hypothetical protein BDP55DRAFT_30111 [Colletotrichum godetiae]|uniref:Uncharacterized protein n=1 Tax=Colletotrichum godetiae TaxID=1209918 RepID=A0AAJ0AR17_9PEZI|nr:uncharacterized protein BDP55DRAFT_30111 [Colletotrichum godetiae]KAK1688791.1 hypothetical protein BDP55DRAFT_30111 [Colletotrichum godetiae]
MEAARQETPLPQNGKMNDFCGYLDTWIHDYSNDSIQSAHRDGLGWKFLFHLRFVIQIRAIPVLHTSPATFLLHRLFIPWDPESQFRGYLQNKHHRPSTSTRPPHPRSVSRVLLEPLPGRLLPPVVAYAAYHDFPSYHNCRYRPLCLISPLSPILGVSTHKPTSACRAPAINNYPVSPLNPSGPYLSLSAPRPSLRRFRLLITPPKSKNRQARKKSC